jgi:hypothetical protein
VTAYSRELCSRLAPLGALLAALVLAGCGIKGGLEPPPGSPPQAAAEPTSARPLGGPPAPRASARPDQPFPLDPLL